MKDILIKCPEIRLVCFGNIPVLTNFTDLEKNYLRELEVELKIFFSKSRKYKQNLKKLKLIFSMTREKFCDKFEEALLLLSNSRI
jgi:hypothetical protein